MTEKQVNLKYLNQCFAKIIPKNFTSTNVKNLTLKRFFNLVKYLRKYLIKDFYMINYYKTSQYYQSPKRGFNMQHFLLI